MLTTQHCELEFTVLQIAKSNRFDRWLSGLRDRVARAPALVRIDRLGAGNAGDIRPVGDGLSELRIDFAPGYRVYFMRKGALMIVLLAGGDKSTQEVDIKRAKAIAKEWE